MIIIMKENENSERLTSFWDLKNADDLYDEILDKLKQFDKDENGYETDVYLYVDDDLNGRLYDFTNVGGNSWLDDDHYLLWVDKQRYETGWSNYFTEVSEIANALEMSEYDLKKEVLDYLNRDFEEDNWYDIDSIGYADVYSYIQDERSDYADTLEEIRRDAIDSEFNDYYDDRREQIIIDFDSDL